MCKSVSIIPRPSKQSGTNIPTAQKVFRTSVNTVVFSFEAYNKTEYFNLDGTCQNWASEMMDMMQDVSTHTVGELTSGKYGKSSIKPPINGSKRKAILCITRIRDARWTSWWKRIECFRHSFAETFLPMNRKDNRRQRYGFYFCAGYSHNPFPS